MSPENNPIPDAELAEVKRLREAAPVYTWGVGKSPRNGRVQVHNGQIQVCAVWSTYQNPAQGTAEYIAALHNAFPGLIARLEEKELQLSIQTTSASMRGRSLVEVYKQIEELQRRLEAAERERDDRMTMAARAQEALRYVINGLPTTDAVWAAYGNADSARAWLADRDEQQRREGAAEWLEKAAREGGCYERSSEGMLEEAKQLREGK